MTAQEAGLATSWGLSSCIQTHAACAEGGSRAETHTSVAMGSRGWRKRPSPGLAAGWLWKVKGPNKVQLPPCLWPGVRLLFYPSSMAVRPQLGSAHPVWTQGQAGKPSSPLTQQHRSPCCPLAAGTHHLLQGNLPLRGVLSNVTNPLGQDARLI